MLDMGRNRSSHAYIKVKRGIFQYNVLVIAVKHSWLVSFIRINVNANILMQKNIHLLYMYTF